MTFPVPSQQPTTRTLNLRRPARLGLAALVAASVALVPASGALAAGSSASKAHPAAKVAAAKDQPGKDRPGSGGIGGRERWWGFGRALHGESFVERPDGTVADVVFQFGTVQALTATSLTLVSKDGFTTTWTLTPTTRTWVRGSHKDRSRVPVVGDQAGVWGTGPAAAPTARTFVVSTEPRRKPAPTTPPTTTPTDGPTTPTDGPTTAATDGSSTPAGDVPTTATTTTSSVA
jgi:hypothetical protein